MFSNVSASGASWLVDGGCLPNVDLTCVSRSMDVIEGCQAFFFLQTHPQMRSHGKSMGAARRYADAINRDAHKRQLKRRRQARKA